MFTYPWDIAEQGVIPFVEAMTELGVDRLDVATCYHSAELVAPRRWRNVAVHAEANVAHIALPEDAFSGLRPPPGRLATDEPELYARLADAAADRDLKMTAWTIAFHNTDLALGHPETAIENCFGDRFAHGLCATNPAPRTYAREMTDALCGTGHFDMLMVESLSYLLHGHGHPHELWGVRMDAHTRFLLSMCFCPFCMDEGETRGLDGPGLKTRVADELSRTWNAPIAVERSPDDGTELASRLVQDDDFAGWVKMRCEVVNGLAGEIADIVHGHDMQFEISAAVWGRPSSLNWTEGVDIAASARIADRFLLESYYPDAGDVARELDHVTGYAPAERLGMVQTVWPSHHRSLGGLMAKVDLALSLGIERIGLYNYSMAPAPVLPWVKAVSDRLRSA